MSDKTPASDIKSKTTAIALSSEIELTQSFAQLVATVVDLEDLFAAGLELLAQHCNCEVMAVWLTGEQVADLHLVSIRTSVDGDLETILQPFIDQALRTQMTLSSAEVDIQTQPISLHSVLAVPLTLGRLAMGVLVAAHYTPDHFQTRHANLFALIASQMTIAVSNARLYAATREHQQQELTRRQVASHLQKLSTIINATLDLDDVLRLILEHIEVVIPYHSALIMLLEGNQLVVSAAAGYDESVRWTTVNAGQGGILQQVLLQQYPAIFADITSNPFWLVERPDFMRDIRAWIGAPLVIKNRIIGLLTLHHHNPGNFDNADADLVHTFANQAAVAIENAQLYQREQHKVKQFQLVAKIGRQATEIYEVQPLLDAVVARLHRELAYEFITIFLYNSQTEKLVLKASNDDLLTKLDDEHIYLDVSSSGVISTVARKTEAMLVNDVRAFDSYFSPPGREAVQSELSIPLVTKGHLVGVLDLQSTAAHAFSPDDLALAQTIADQVAVAIETANLFEERDQRLAELIAFNQIGIAIADPSNLEETLHYILGRIKALYQVEGTSLLMIEDGRLHFKIAVGLPDEIMRPFSLSLGEGIGGWVAKHGQPLRVNDVARDRRHYKQVDQAIDFKTQKLLAVPVQIQGRVLGVIEVMNRLDGKDFSQDDEVILSFIASAIAITIENSRLFAEISKISDRMMALLETSQAMTNLDLDHVLSGVVRQAVQLLDSEWAIIYLVNLSLAQAVPKHLMFHPQTNTRGYLPSMPVSLNDASDAVAQIVQNKSPMVIDQTTADGRLAHLLAASLPLRSVLAVPVIINGEVTAVLEVANRLDGQTFTISDKTLLGTLAGQAAIAMHNAQLFQAVLEREDAALALGEAGISINQNLHLDAVLTDICNQSFNVFDIDAVGVWRLEGEPAMLRCVMAKGGWLERLMQAQFDPQDSDNLVARVLAESKPTHFNGYQPPHSQDPFYGQRAYAVLGVPLLSRGRSLGALLLFNHREGYAFSNSDQARALIYGNQVITALENAQLHQETERRLTEVSTLYTLAHRMTADVGIDRLLEDTVSVIRLVLDTTGCSIFVMRHDRLSLGAENGSISIAGHAFILKTTQQIIDTLKPINYRDQDDFPHYDEPPPRDMVSLLVVPLVSHSQLIGSVAVYDDRPAAFGDNEGRLLTIVAAQVASAVENFNLFNSIQQHARNLEQALSNLRELHRLQGEFVQNVSHELRTPITFVRGYVDLILEGSLGAIPDEVKHSLEIVARRTSDLSRLVNDIITHQQLEMNVLHFRDTNLNDVIALAVESAMPMAQQNEIELETAVETPLPIIRADPDRIGQVFDNLIGNAIKFTDAGGCITVAAHRDEAKIWVSVRDTGIGIAREDLPKVFNRFYQTDGSTTRRYGGTGLGLTIVQQIVEAHQGQITVESEVGTGTTFTFCLPLDGSVLPA